MATFDTQGQALRADVSKAWNYAKKVADDTKALIDKYPRSAKALNSAKKWQDLSNVFAAEWKVWADKTEGWWDSRRASASEYQTILARGMEIAGLYSAMQQELLAKREEILKQDEVNRTPPVVVKQAETVAKTVNDAVAPGVDTPGGKVGGGLLATLQNLPMAAKLGAALVVVVGIAWATGAFGKAAAPAVAGLRRRRRRR